MPVHVSTLAFAVLKRADNLLLLRDCFLYVSHLLHIPHPYMSLLHTAY